MATTKQKVKIPPWDQFTEWEQHLFEQNVGVGVDHLHEYVRGPGPKKIIDITLRWLILRRTMPQITLEEAGSGPFENDLTDFVKRSDDDDEETDPLDQSPTPSSGDGPGEPSSG